MGDQYWLTRPAPVHVALGSVQTAAVLFLKWITAWLQATEEAKLLKTHYPLPMWCELAGRPRPPWELLMPAFTLLSWTPDNKKAKNQKKEVRLWQMDLRIKLNFCCFISPADVGDQNNASGDSQVCIYSCKCTQIQGKEKLSNR